MKINEIFYSIQGEGRWSGLPNIFIRATGCNLRCSYCDTKYAYNEGKEFTVENIIQTIDKYPCKYVCITGGEPLEQKENKNLIEKLLGKKYDICIETNGSQPIQNLPNNNELLISLDIKCPSSNMNEKMIFENISLLKEKDQLKFVIQNKYDYNYAKKTLQKYKPCCPVFFQPVWGTNPKNLAGWIIKDGLNVKLGLQLHKILFGDKKGI